LSHPPAKRQPLKERNIEALPTTETPQVEWKLIGIDQTRSDPRRVTKKDQETQANPEVKSVEVQTDPVIVLPHPPVISPSSSPEEQTIDISRPPLTPTIRNKLQKAKKKLDRLFK